MTVLPTPPADAVGDVPRPSLFGKIEVGACFVFNPHDDPAQFEYQKIAAGRLRRKATGREFRQRANQLVWLLSATTP
jgi:hypothetical protein